MNSVSCGDSELPVVELRTGVQHYIDRNYCLRGVPAALHGAELVTTPWRARAQHGGAGAEGTR